MRKILIIGATSAIAVATARTYAQRGDHLYLVARNAPRLKAIADDLTVRGSLRLGYEAMDANDFDAHAAMLARAEAALGGLDTVLIAHGTLPDQKACERSVESTLKEIKTNALSTIAILTHVANRFEAQRRGTIAVISSVAGDRGRESNYLYGSAKAMVSAFLSGLRQRLAKSGVAVVTIKPGFVDTPMTAAFKKGALWARPEAVAAGIVKAINRGTPVAYLPGYWYWIMLIAKHVPERIFSKLKM